MSLGSLASPRFVQELPDLHSPKLQTHARKALGNSRKIIGPRALSCEPTRERSDMSSTDEDTDRQVPACVRALLHKDFACSRFAPFFAHG